MATESAAGLKYLTNNAISLVADKLARSWRFAQTIDESETDSFRLGESPRWQGQTGATQKDLSPMELRRLTNCPPVSIVNYTPFPFPAVN